MSMVCCLLYWFLGIAVCLFVITYLTIFYIYNRFIPTKTAIITPCHHIFPILHELTIPFQVLCPFYSYLLSFRFSSFFIKFQNSHLLSAFLLPLHYNLVTFKKKYTVRKLAFCGIVSTQVMLFILVSCNTGKC